MKTFRDLVEENQPKKPVVVGWGRMNPPTTGHLKLIDKVRAEAEKRGAKHSVIVSHSQDAKKNPLSAKQKIKHLQRYSPGTHFEASSKEKPTLLHHASRLHAAGHDHLVVVAGSDRVKEFHDLLHKYNGVKGRHGHYKFKKISVVSAGHRDPDAEGEEGMSGTKMRQHAANRDFSSFRHGVPSHVSDQHAKELMHDVRRGMGMNEQVDRGMFKALFITGGPGSGKDVIIREAVAEEKAVELNFTQVIEILNSIHHRAVRSMFAKSDINLESVMQRKPLIINGPAHFYEEVSTIKSQLESLGYDTFMIYVDTSNEESKIRNESHKRMMNESNRLDKWNASQSNKQSFDKLFEYFITFDNNGSIDNKEEDIHETYQLVKQFLDYKVVNETAMGWLSTHGKLNLDDKFNMVFKEENVKSNSKLIQKATIKKYNPSFKAAGPADITKDNSNVNIGNTTDRDELRGDALPRKNPNGKTVTGGTWSGGYTAEASQPTISKKPEPKESNFSQDKDKIKKKKFGDTSLSKSRVGKPAGVGPEYDTRAGGQGAAAGAGLGDQTYSESQDYSNASPSSAALPGGSVQPNPLSNQYDQPKPFNKFRKKLKEWNGFQNDVESGLGGTLGGASNKEPMQTPNDKFIPNMGIKIKKSKLQVIKKNIKK
jgi:predicted kinase